MLEIEELNQNYFYYMALKIPFSPILVSNVLPLHNSWIHGFLLKLWVLMLWV